MKALDDFSSFLAKRDSTVLVPTHADEFVSFGLLFGHLSAGR